MGAKAFSGEFVRNHGIGSPFASKHRTQKPRMPSEMIDETLSNSAAVKVIVEGDAIQGAAVEVGVYEDV